VRLSYSWVKDALQLAGLVPKHRARGRHRRRREPRACFGELLHIDGSPHAWFALAPDERPTLIAVPDDATNRLLYAQFWEAETTAAIMTALGEVFTTQGLPMALYTDRAHWAFHTPKAKGPVDTRRLTQVGRALAALGVEHIPAYSPQARGRSERLNRTLQDRLVNELRVAGITTIPAANAYLREVYLPQHDATFSHPPRDPESAWVALGDVDLDQILCHQETRTVGQDNTVVLDHVVLQVAKQPGRRTCVGLEVVARRHLDGRHSVWRGAPTARPLRCHGPACGRGHGGARASAPPAHEAFGPATEHAAGPPRPPASMERTRTNHLLNGTGQFTCQQQHEGLSCLERVAAIRIREFFRRFPALRVDRGGPRGGPL
jgi:hypothetical protein